MSTAITYVARSIPTNRVRRFQEQPREYFDPEEIAARAASMSASGQQTPIIVEAVQGDPAHDYELIDGESRWRSAQQAGITEILAIVRITPFKSMAEKHLAALVANFNRSEHTAMEISNALQRQIGAGMLQVNLARAIGKGDVWVSQYLSLQNLHPELQRMLDPRLTRRERIPLSTAFLLARAQLEKQLAVLEGARRADGKVMKWRIDELLSGQAGGERRRRRRGNKQRREAIMNAIRALGVSASRILHATREEAQKIAQELKDAGEIPEAVVIEDLINTLKRANPATEGASYSFPDLPLRKEGESEAAHADKLRSYWLQKASGGNPDRLLIAVAYPHKIKAPPFKPTKWHKELK